MLLVFHGCFVGVRFIIFFCHIIFSGAFASCLKLLWWGCARRRFLISEKSLLYHPGIKKKKSILHMKLTSYTNP